MANIILASTNFTDTSDNKTTFGENKELYSVRIDTTASYDTTVINKFLEKINPYKYLFGREVGTTGGRPHFQGVIWCDSKLSQQLIVKTRNMVSYHLLKGLDYSGSKKCQPISFCKSKNPKSLVSYCSKDQDLFTDLTAKQIESIPQWLEKREWKLDLKAQLDIVLEKRLSRIRNRSFVLSDEPTYTQFCLIFHEEYTKLYKKNCFYRNTFYASALEHKVISKVTFLEKIGVLDAYGDTIVTIANQESIINDYDTY